MPGVKLTNLLGKAPKIAPELLPDTAAQVARNCKLYSGDLIPYPTPVVVDNTGRIGETKTIFGLRDPDDESNLVWLAWDSDVSIVTETPEEDERRRFYYTGDGVPKVSNFDLATDGSQPYPVKSYELGLPLPEDDEILTTTPTVYTEKTTQSVARDDSGIVTLKTTAPHNLKTGNFISVSEFAYRDGTYTQSSSNRTGSYSQPADTLTIMITVTDHGLTSGATASLTFSGHSSINGAYTVSVVDKDRFAVTGPDASSRSGTVTWTNVGSTAITVTINNHGLSNGASVTLDFTSGTAPDGTFTISNVTTNTFRVFSTVGASSSGNVKWDIRGFNVVNAECTVEDDTTITYFSPGPKVSTYTTGDGRLNLAGLTQARSYVYSWYTPWGEESIGSKPSDEEFIKEGVTVTVSDIPTAPPSGNNFIRGVRLYRTLPSQSGTEYFRLATLWFPFDLNGAVAKRESNLVTITTTEPHNLSEGNIFKISGASTASFNITDGEVEEFIDEYTFTYAQTDSDVPDTTLFSGTIYYDVSENPPDTTPRYWGDGGNYDFVDDFDSTALFDILTTDEFLGPPDDLQGLIRVQSNFLAGFVGNKLYFSELGEPHAWPRRYTKTFEENIVALTVINGNILVLTDGYPYLVYGSDPAAMTDGRIDAYYPCLSAKSVVNMGYGVVYSTHDGLAVYSPTATVIITQLLYNRDTWREDFDPSTVIAQYYGANYVASADNAGFVYEQDQKAQLGGFFVDTDFSYTASWYDSVSGNLFLASGTDGDIFQWDAAGQPRLTQEWKSKVIVTKDFLNLGAGRVIADYESGASTQTWNGTSTDWNNTSLTWNGVSPIVFKLWVNKQLKAQKTLVSGDMFRLPTGYLSDTFELGVEGNVRVRAIHLAETPSGLREV